ncbi:MAG: hypothetical protein R3E62_02500 [Pseudomonadales bacterium]|jgi:hypothetical protein
MKVTSSFLPPLVNQPPLKAGRAVEQPVNEARPEPAKGDEAVRLVVGEVETALERQRARREFVDLRTLQESPVSFNSFRALSSYQQVESGNEPVDGLAHLDIFV